MKISDKRWEREAYVSVSVDSFYHSLVLYNMVHHMPCSSAAFMVSALLSTLNTFIPAHEWVYSSLYGSGRT